MKGEKSHGPVSYRMHVIAHDPAEVVAHAGGLMVDRMMSGWRVSVQLLDTTAADVRPVQILGAEIVDATTVPDMADDDRCVLVMGAQAYDEAISVAGQGFPAGCADVLVWGAAREPQHEFGHHLSAAARAFKAEAVAATGHLPPGEVAAVESFTAARQALASCFCS